MDGNFLAYGQDAICNDVSSKMAVWLRQIQTGVAYVVLLFLFWTDGYQCSRITGTACALQDGTKV